MPELPWVKWFPTCWASEPGLRQCEAATRGIWFEALNTMFLFGAGSISGTEAELSELLLCRIPQIQVAIAQLKQYKVADVIEQNRTNDEHNVTYTISCRRNVRTVAIKKLKIDAGRASGASRRTKREHASTSTSTSTSGNGECEGKGGDVPTLDELREFSACNGILESTAKKLFDYYQGKNLWLNRNGRLINWKHELQVWQNRDRENQPTNTNPTNYLNERRPTSPT